MNIQCQSCGAFEGGTKPTAPCEHCSAIICSGCRTRHVARCEQVQKAKKLGQGTTVHQTFVPSSDLPPLPEVEMATITAPEEDAAPFTPDEITTEDKRTVLFTPAPPIPEGRQRFRYVDAGAVNASSLPVDDLVSDTQSLTPEAAAGLAETFAAEIEAQTPTFQENAPEAAPTPATEVVEPVADEFHADPAAAASLEQVITSNPVAEAQE